MAQVELTTFPPEFRFLKVPTTVLPAILSPSQQLESLQAMHALILKVTSGDVIKAQIGDRFFFAHWHSDSQLEDHFSRASKRKPATNRAYIVQGNEGPATLQPLEAADWQSWHQVRIMVDFGGDSIPSPRLSLLAQVAQLYRRRAWLEAGGAWRLPLLGLTSSFSCTGRPGQRLGKVGSRTELLFEAAPVPSTYYTRHRLARQLDALLAAAYPPALRPRSFLVHGVAGCGKSATVRAFAARHGMILEEPTLQSLSSGQVGSQPLAHHFRSAAALGNTVLLHFDPLDVFFPASADGPEPAAVQFAALLDSLRQGAFRNVLVFGSCRDPGRLEPLVRRGFDEEVAGDLPSPAERRAILARLLPPAALPQRLGNSKKETDKDKEEEDEEGEEGEAWPDLAGFSCTDLTALARLVPFLPATPSNSTSPEPSTAAEPGSVLAAAARLRAPSVLAQFELAVPRVRWADVAGLSAAKAALEAAVVWPRAHAAQFAALGLRPATGALLYGPPGTGKTLLARAVATAAASRFLSLSIAQLVTAHVGESEKQLAELFRRARAAAPCVVFIDEFQAVFSRRGRSETSDGLVAQLLLEMDGLAAAGLFLLAATNAPAAVDPAFLSPARLSTAVWVGLPDQLERQEILLPGLSQLSYVPGLSAADVAAGLAAATERWTPADLTNLARRVGATAQDRGAHLCSQEDVAAALAGLEPTVTEEMLQEYEAFRARTQAL